jgi:acyl carrier protein
MSRDDIKSGIITCFQSIGIMVADDNLSDDLEIQEYIEDSIMFITMIIELESYFNIEIPDEFLLPETISSLGALTDLVTKLLNG